MDVHCKFSSVVMRSAEGKVVRRERLEHPERAALRGQLERSPLARRPVGVPGFGLILAHTLMAEMGRIERFRNHSGLARYSLLAPISRDTGEADGSRVPQGRLVPASCPA